MTNKHREKLQSQITAENIRLIDRYMRSNAAERRDCVVELSLNLALASSFADGDLPQEYAKLKMDCGQMADTLDCSARILLDFAVKSRLVIANDFLEYLIHQLAKVEEQIKFWESVDGD